MSLSNRESIKTCRIIFYLFGVFILIIFANHISVFPSDILFSGKETFQQHHQTLSFAERVAFQKAIEKVNWQHLIWPDINPGQKPCFNDYISEKAIRTKVEETLIQSNVLDYYWNDPITGQQLQSEINRLVDQTHNPTMLNEIFSALENNPYLIAECFARSTLVNRIIRKYYAYDERIHGTLRSEAEHDLAIYSIPGQLIMMSGKYSEYTLNKEDYYKTNGINDYVLRNDEWDLMSNRLLDNRKKFDGFDSPKASISDQNHTLWDDSLIGIRSPLQEDETSFYVTEILDRDSNTITIGRSVWEKTSFKEWLKNIAPCIPGELPEPQHQYQLPKISSTKLNSDTWELMGLQERIGHTAVWTGSEMIIFGGYYAGNTGAKYDPLTHVWSPISNEKAPSARYMHTAVWTGQEMIVWGGEGCPRSLPISPGGRYNPNTDSWVSTTTINEPTARYSHSAVWTGTEMVVWGGYSYELNYFNTGGKYNPVTDSWIDTSLSNAPEPRKDHTATWTGNEMVIWGGSTSGSRIITLNTGGRYYPDSDTWEPTTTLNAPSPCHTHTTVWTGQEMIIWGRESITPGGKYYPSIDTWSTVSTLNAPFDIYANTAIWNGEEMIIWGGYDSIQHQIVNEGSRYNPILDSWLVTSTLNAPSPRRDHTAVWTGSEMIIFGGYDEQNYTYFYPNTTGRYCPTTDMWTLESSCIPQTPTPRSGHTAIWNGVEMIIWGGKNDFYNTRLNTGGRYNPTLDLWVEITTDNAPVARNLHSAIWTGSEMIVWGGRDSLSSINSGGKYNPALDTWTSVSTFNVPQERSNHTAIWTGAEMIVWGGCVFSSSLTNTGGRYDPVADSWIAISTNNAPCSRIYFSTIWTGAEMVVWGGNGTTPKLNTGGRYNVLADSWQPMSLKNALDGRTNHTAIWTGDQMLIWGGYPAYMSTTIFGIYDPYNDCWLPASSPSLSHWRYNHTAVWTGVEMITWGGSGDGYLSDTGERYKPDDDSLISMTAMNAPSCRQYHTAIWTGYEMIVWGGESIMSAPINTGAHYIPANQNPPVPSLTPWSIFVILGFLSLCFMFCTSKMF